MQIIVVSRHLKTARTIDIMPRHLLAGAGVLIAAVVALAMFFSWLSVQWRLPLVEDLLLSVHEQQTRKRQDYVSSNLQLMANRLGELQARVLQLDALGERMSGLLGVKREVPPAAPARPAAGQGGPYVPAELSAGELLREIDALSFVVEQKAEDLALLQSLLVEKRVKDRLLPTTQPVRDAELGSPFGYRIDPFEGTRALHEGMDFSADVGTPVYAAAEGVVFSAERRPDYGNVIDVDHGEGLVSRYAHLSRIDVRPGQLVKRGEPIGLVGSTGRSTGAHLHFEVRIFGIAQNPARFLQPGATLAQMRRR